MVIPTYLQPIIMAAGRGSRMTELTNVTPKCLLPLGNVHMIWFPINFLQKNGFKDVIIVVFETNLSEIQTVIEKYDFKINIDIVGVPFVDDYGTADSLRFLEESDKIKSDILVLSCDLVTDVSLQPLIDIYIRNGAAISVLFVRENCHSPQLPVPGPNTKEKPEKDLVGICEKTSRLFFFQTLSDHKEVVTIPSESSKKWKNIKIDYELTDVHIYIINRQICRYLVKDRTISTIKGELIPLVVRKQTEKKKKKEDKKTSHDEDEEEKPDLLDFYKKTDSLYLSKFLLGLDDPTDDLLRCTCHISKNLTFRVNTFAEYTRVNRLLLQKWPEMTGIKERISSTATVESRQLETKTCLVGESANISEKTSIKSSLISSNVTVSPKTRIMSSIIMQSATIGVCCAIQNCIICEGAVVSDGCNLIDCFVGGNFTVPTGSKHAQESLTNFDYLTPV